MKIKNPHQQDEPQPSRRQLRKQFIREVGYRVYFQHQLDKYFGLFPEIRLKNPHAQFPFWFRTGTSDIDVFRQIFRDREYRCFDDLADPKFIIDCGANVGYSSIYFLSRFPHAFVVAIEPDPSNFAMLVKNLKPYAGRFKAMRAAIWPKPAGLIFPQKIFGDGRAWSVTVQEAGAGEKSEIEGITVEDLLSKSEFERIDILKIDIEGAESEIFSAGFHQWLSKVDNMCIELHGKEAERIFNEAVAGEKFEVSQSEELVVCRRIKPSEDRTVENK